MKAFISVSSIKLKTVLLNLIINLFQIKIFVPDKEIFVSTKIFSGPESVPADAAAPDRARLRAAAAEDAAARPAEVPAAPGGGGGDPAQDHADLPQSVFPRRHGRGELSAGPR